MCAGLTCFEAHVSPPSLEVATTIGAAPDPWNLAKQT